MEYAEFLASLRPLDAQEKAAQAQFYAWNAQQGQLPLSDGRIPMSRPQGYTVTLQEPVISEEAAFPPGANIALTRHPRYFTSVPHTHAFFELVYVVEGHCRQRIDQQEFVLEQGDMCILPPGVYHAPEAFSEQDLSINLQLRRSAFWEMFGGLLTAGNAVSDFFLRVLRQAQPEHYLIFRMPGDETIRQLVVCMLQEDMRRAPYYQTVLEAGALLLFSLILRNHCAHAAVYSTAEKRTNTAIISILHDLEARPEDLSLGALAAQYGYSPSPLSRIFRAYTGETFSAFRRRLRMQHAAALLRQTDRSISEIAAGEGYGSLSDFYKAFRQFYGQTPQAYRRGGGRPDNA